MVRSDLQKLGAFDESCGAIWATKAVAREVVLYRNAICINFGAILML